MKSISVYTDGASRGNPGKGGWAAIVLSEDKVRELSGREDNVTNNQMELQAVIEGLSYAKKNFPNEDIELHADSRYVLSGIEKWLDGWQRNGWQTMAKKPVENRDRWEQLLLLRDHFGKKLKLTKVDGHSGHLYNDRCDDLAVRAALEEPSSSFSDAAKDYEQFLKDTSPLFKTEKNKKTKNTQAAYSYVSLVDGEVYVDKDWKSCEARVKGKAAKYKKVFSKAEETDLLQEYTLSSLL